MIEPTKPCPFCGGVHIRLEEVERGIAMHCIECDCYGPSENQWTGDYRWNTRATPPTATPLGPSAQTP